MLPSDPRSPSQYLHLVSPNLSLPPAREDVGEFVALPLCIEPPVGDIESLMNQTVFPSGTNRTLSIPSSSFLKIGLPMLQSPFSNLLEIDLG